MMPLPLLRIVVWAVVLLLGAFLLYTTGSTLAKLHDSGQSGGTPVIVVCVIIMGCLIMGGLEVINMVKAYNLLQKK